MSVGTPPKLAIRKCDAWAEAPTWKVNVRRPLCNPPDCISKKQYNLKVFMCNQQPEDLGKAEWSSVMFLNNQNIYITWPVDQFL